MEQDKSAGAVSNELAACLSLLSLFICSLIGLFVFVYFASQIRSTDSYMRAKIKIQEQIVQDMVSHEVANLSRQDEMLKALINDLDARL